MSEEAVRTFAIVWVGLLGAVVGSFLNVVIARVPHGESVVSPRSRCPRCGAGIAWYDNVPIVSWVVLRARCRACRAPISWRYPLVEALGAAAALAAFARHGFTPRALAELAFVALLLALAAIDLDTWLLPHALTWPLLGGGVALSVLRLTAAPSVRSAVLGAAIGFGAFAAISWIGSRALRKEALGFGDVWLLAGLGAWLGVGALLPVVLLASLQGSIVGLSLIALGRSQPGPPEPESEPEPEPGPADVSARETGAEALPPADATAEAPDDEEWVPPRHAVPFGPFLVAGALQWLYLAHPLARAFPTLRVFL